ncbi:MAG: retroviral-like aspartic protease family protein [Chloroflexi bacterium]|nr:retroviral-like aspartic protease family protein [Chloroflexota bacterium]
MGTFHVTVQIGDPRGTRFETVEALVDTGASHTRVPRSTLERLGVRPEERWPFRLADDREAEYDVAETQVHIDGRTRSSIVVFGEEGSEALLGAHTLEGFRLGVDPVGRRLIPVPGLLMSLGQSRSPI